ncbi:MAG: ribonuclease D [Lentisphaeraceae bacterium]|nr:ribonuclease D [Lentisphaeraceae bacterium]
MYITSQNEADEIFERLSHEKFVAIDSEFHWTRTYNPIPALIQVGTADEHYLIDVTEIKDYTSLGKFLEKEDCTKIIHSCSQDLILFYLMTKKVTKNIFDSQIAYSFYNNRHQISFGGMVEELTGEALSKGSQRSNWLKRPLSPTQLQYAANDVIWLMKCFPALQEELEKRERTTWLKEECALYENDDFYAVTPSPLLYKNVKGAGRLNRLQLSVLRELCAWREKVAIKLDLRPKIFIPDNALLSIVYKNPTNTKELRYCDDISPNVMRYNSQDIINCVEVGLAVPGDQHPPVFEKRIPPKQEEKLADKIFSAVNEKSETHEVAANLLMTKAICRKIASKSSKGKEFDFDSLSKWRQNILKEDITNILKNF